MRQQKPVPVKFLLDLRAKIRAFGFAAVTQQSPLVPHLAQMRLIGWGPVRRINCYRSARSRNCSLHAFKSGLHIGLKIVSIDCVSRLKVKSGGISQRCQWRNLTGTQTEAEYIASGLIAPTILLHRKHKCDERPDGSA